ncbi:MAG: hypothetical protein KAY37_12240, partial [Phycisphaerae bacterium]|nr:hypothetical protein [Phycisphaerae bacterium]
RRTLSEIALVLCVAAQACAVPALAQTSQARVAILFGAKGPYQTAADALAEELRAGGYESILIEWPAGDGEEREKALQQVVDFKPTVVATGGTTATMRALEAVPEVPVVFFMVPNALDAPFLADNFPARKRVAGIASDIDPAQQIDWLKRTSPMTGKTAVLCSSHSQRTAAALEKAGRDRGLVVTALPAARDEFPKAIDALNNGRYEGVLMIPDARVYNSPNVQRLLLWGARQKKPIWTFSPNVVKAGAFTGLYCDSKAIGKQAAQMIKDVVGGKKPETIGLQYPRSIGRAVNVHMAEMIGIALNDEEFNSKVVRLGDRP